MVGSTVPRLDDKWPPVLATLSSTKARSSCATCGSCARVRRRRSAGLAMAGSSGAAAVLGMSVLAVAFDDLVGQQAQARGAVQAAARQRGMRLVAQLGGVAACGLEAEHGDVGRFVGVLVLAGSLAQRLGQARHVEDVVD